MTRMIIPVRYSAWMTGDIGAFLTDYLADRTTKELRLLGAGPKTEARPSRLNRGIVLECDEAPGVFMTATRTAVEAMEREVASRYPVLHHEMGGVWTGTIQAAFE